MPLIFPVPPREHVDTFHRLLSRSMGPERVESLVEVLGPSFYYVLSVMAGVSIKFPGIDGLEAILFQAKVHDSVSARVSDGFTQEDAIREFAAEYRKGLHHVRRAFDIADRELMRIEVVRKEKKRRVRTRHGGHSKTVR